MKVIYVAGKYRDERGEYWVRQNILMAEEYALLVWKCGGVALCPHKNTSGFGGAITARGDDVWLEGDLELISRCDAVWAIPDWENSSGAVKEVEFAKARNIPVLYHLTEVHKFIQQ